MFKISTSTQAAQTSNTNSASSIAVITNTCLQRKKFFVSLSQKKHFKSKYTSNNQNGRWTKDEHNKFIEAIILYGNDWKKVQKHVSTRTGTQARSHAQKFLMKLKQCDMIVKKKINLNMSWAKSIQIIKNEFNNDELNKLLHSVSHKQNSLTKYAYSCKKALSNSDDCNYHNNNDIDIYNDDMNSVVSNSTEINSVDVYHANGINMFKWDEDDKGNTTGCKDKKEYIKSFMENFRTRKVSFDCNDEYLYSWKVSGFAVNES